MCLSIVLFNSCDKDEVDVINETSIKELEVKYNVEITNKNNLPLSKADLKLIEDSLISFKQKFASIKTTKVEKMLVGPQSNIERLQLSAQIDHSSFIVLELTYNRTTGTISHREMLMLANVNYSYQNVFWWHSISPNEGKIDFMFTLKIEEPIDPLSGIMITSYMKCSGYAHLYKDDSKLRIDR